MHGDGCIGIGLGNDGGLALVTGHTDEAVHGDGAEEGDIGCFGETFAAAFTKDIAGHIFDDAKDGDFEFLEHAQAATCVFE